ncbi:hypothetical protein An14g06410 [Aspergillus niger]|uniref:Uncharacterized protein n=2 Tax=Aspergillus niger TaxID=5061 RepID=A2R434_ASPNC|nr:hypothetical protein An14g06410 [Aspergillus niger]CAK97214.1 hypothetical protein An14g06410 [Aspergillus niger]
MEGLSPTVYLFRGEGQSAYRHNTHPAGFDLFRKAMMIPSPREGKDYSFFNRSIVRRPLRCEGEGGNPDEERDERIDSTIGPGAIYRRSSNSESVSRVIFAGQPLLSSMEYRHTAVMVEVEESASLPGSDCQGIGLSHPSSSSLAHFHTLRLCTTAAPMLWRSRPQSTLYYIQDSCLFLTGWLTRRTNLSTGHILYIRTVGAYLASALPARLPTADYAWSSMFYDEIWGKDSRLTARGMVFAGLKAAWKTSCLEKKNSRTSRLILRTPPRLLRSRTAPYYVATCVSFPVVKWQMQLTYDPLGWWFWAFSSRLLSTYVSNYVGGFPTLPRDLLASSDIIVASVRARDEKLCETRINNCARVGYVVGQDNQDKSHSPGDGGIWNAVSHPPCADGLISRSVAAWRSSSSSSSKVGEVRRLGAPDSTAAHDENSRESETNPDMLARSGFGKRKLRFEGALRVDHWLGTNQVVG